MWAAAVVLPLACIPDMFCIVCAALYLGTVWAQATCVIVDATGVCQQRVVKHVM